MSISVLQSFTPSMLLLRVRARLRSSLSYSLPSLVSVALLVPQCDFTGYLALDSIVGCRIHWSYYGSARMGILPLSLGFTGARAVIIFAFALCRFDSFGCSMTHTAHELFEFPDECEVSLDVEDESGYMNGAEALANVSPSATLLYSLS